jgi:hypothetical protein
MGASISLSSQATDVSVIAKQVQKCPITNCVNTVGDINITASGNSHVPPMYINQTCTVDSTCLYDAVSDAAVKAFQDNMQTAGPMLGLAATASMQDIRLRLQQYQQQECGTQTAGNTLGNININFSGNSSGDLIQITQSSQASTKCALTAMAKAAAAASNSNTQSAGISTAGIVTICVIAGAILVALGIGAIVLKMKMAPANNAGDVAALAGAIAPLASSLAPMAASFAPMAASLAPLAATALGGPMAGQFARR